MLIRVRNWERYQHYKHRNPPWIKLHTELLDNYEFSCLSDASKLLAICICLVAARCDNRIPADQEWIKKRANLAGKVDLAPLLRCGFLEEIQELPSSEHVASTMLAPCSQGADSEKRQSRDRDREERRADAPVIQGLDQEAWGRWESYRTKIKKPIGDVSREAAQRQMVKFGAQQSAAVEHSIANGYRGLFAPSEAKQAAKPHTRAKSADELEAEAHATGRS